MADRTMDLALRIRTDLGNAAEEVAQLGSEVDKLGTTGKRASTGVAALSTATDKDSASRRKHAAAVKNDAAALTDIEAKAKAAGISVGQYGMAMRMLPAQMTDISVGLATGQSPFMVLMQQGGQLKDSFGGIVPAARAVGGSIMGLVNPYTLAAGAVAGLGIAWAKQQEELSAYNQALILTGGYSESTVTQLKSLAAEMDGLAGVTTSSAAEVITAVAATGRIAGQDFEAASKAVAVWSEATGESVDDVVERFVKLSDDPVNAILELNRSQHFLTEETLKQIRSLVEQGRQAEAVTLAIQTYSGVLIDRSQQMTDSLGGIEWAMKGLKNMAREAGDAIIDMFRAPTDGGRIKQLKSNIESMQELIGNHHWWNGGGVYGGMSDEQLRAGIASAEAEIERLRMSKEVTATGGGTVDTDAEKKADEERKKREAERKAFFAAEARYLADTEKKKRDIAAVNDLLTRGTISQEEATKRIGQIEADYAAKSQKRGTAKKTDAQQAEEAAQRELENLRKQTDMLGLLEGGERRVSEEARIRWEIENGTYKAASAARQQELIAAAQAKDAAEAARAAQEKQRKEAEDTERAYKRLQDTLRTPAEVAVDTALERIEVLNAALKKGSADATDYSTNLSRIVSASFTAPPSFGGLSPEIGGVDSEQYRLQQQKDELEKWYAEQLTRLDEFRRQRSDLNTQWDAQELQLRAQHAQALATLDNAQNQLLMQQTASAFDAMAQAAKAYGGEQSRTYRALFAVSKGFAVAQAAVALAQNVAEASKAGFPQNIGFIAAALAQGAQIASLLSAARFASGGRITGPGTGTSDDVPIWASAGEYMVRHASASQPGAYAFLEDFNQRGMAAVEDRRGYAEGGVITAAPEPQGRFGESTGGRAPSVNNMRLYNYFDMDSLAQALARHPAMEKSIVNVASENGQAIQAEWK